MEIIPVDGHKTEIADMQLAKLIGDTLEQHYPGWAWMVNVDSEGGVVNVINGFIQSCLATNRNHGFTLHLRNIAGRPQYAIRAAIRVGGELLERANVERGPFKNQIIKHVEGVSPHHQPLQVKA